MYLLFEDWVVGELCQMHKFKVKGPELGQDAAASRSPAPAPTRATATEKRFKRFDSKVLRLLNTKATDRFRYIIKINKHASSECIGLHRINVITSLDIYWMYLSCKMHSLHVCCKLGLHKIIIFKINNGKKDVLYSVDDL